MISLKGINPYAAAVITENILKNRPEKLSILLDADIREIRDLADKYGVNISSRKVEDGLVLTMTAEEMEEIDVTGETCPGPVITVGEKLSSLKKGQMIKIKSGNRDTLDDLEVSAAEMNAVVVEKSDDYIILEKTEKKDPVEITGRDRVLVVQSNGTANAERAYATFIFSKAARSMGKEVTIFLLMDGVSLARKGGASNVKHPAFPHLHELMREVIDMGVQIYVCEMSAQFRGIDDSALEDGCKIAGAATFITLLSDPGYAVVNF